MNPNMAMALAAMTNAKGSSELSPLKTSDLFLNNDSLKSNPRSNPTTLGQPSPSGSYASSNFNQNGPFDDHDNSRGGTSNGANFYHQSQMTAFYEQDTSLQISVNLPPPADIFGGQTASHLSPQGCLKSPADNSSFHSSQIS